MRKKTLLLIAPLAILTLFVVSGCGKVSEKAAEKAIEKSTNGAADVDLSTNSIRVNVNGSSWETGDSVSLPSGFPSDIYVVDGTIKVAYANTSDKGYTVSIETSKTPSEVQSTYNEKLTSSGWSIISTANYQGATSLQAQKDNRTISVGASSSDGKTTATITTYTSTETVNTNSETTNTNSESE